MILGNKKQYTRRIRFPPEGRSLPRIRQRECGCLVDVPLCSGGFRNTAVGSNGIPHCSCRRHPENGTGKAFVLVLSL